MTDPTAVTHCPHCLEAQPRVAHFCAECGMPLTPYATTAPLESVWALGWLINRLLCRRPSRFMLFGAWVIALPALLTLPMAAIGIWAAPGQLAEDLWAGVPTVLVAACYLLLAVRVTIAFVRHPGPASREVEAS